VNSSTCATSVSSGEVQADCSPVEQGYFTVRLFPGILCFRNHAQGENAARAELIREEYDA
jgi:hypothetical protein